MRSIADRLAAAQDAEFNRLRQIARRAAAHGGQLFGELAAVVVPRRTIGFQAEGSDPLFDAFRIAAEAIGARVVLPTFRYFGIALLRQVAFDRSTDFGESAWPPSPGRPHHPEPTVLQQMSRR